MSKPQNLYYMASPYSHDDLHIKEYRAELAAIATAALKRLGLHIFAPIPHYAPLEKHGLPGEFEWWQSYDLNMLDRCDGLVVLTLDGWDCSTGVTGEINHAILKHKRVAFISMEDLI